MNAVATIEPTAAKPITELKQQLENRTPDFANALPAHIPVERFKRVILTAIQTNPDLIRADRQSLWNSAMRAAQDGLLPDGREGAIVIYNTKVKDPATGRESYIDKAQWMPMIAGIRKKARNSGELRDWNAFVVFENDQFEYELGDHPFIRHKPALGPNRGKPIAAYSVATFKDGTQSRELMTVEQIEKARAISRAKSAGPWVQWWEEMARKTVARRHSKVLPMSTDLDDLIRRDDGLYDLERARDESREEGRRPKLTEALDRIAGEPMSAKPVREAVNAQEMAGEESQIPVEGDEPESQVDTSPRGVLLESLREKALQGVRPLKLALGKLSVEEQQLITDEDREALASAAEYADASK